MKISIIIDSNICHRGENFCDFKTFNLGAKVDNLITWIQYIRGENINVVVPEMVLKELEKQRIDLYKKKILEFNKFIENYSFPNLEIICNYQKDFDYSKYYKEIFRDFILSQNSIVEIMPISCKLDSIIERAINKRQPFEGKEKQSDKGFKDAVIWESLLQYKRNNPGNKLVYYSCDKRFSDEIKIEYKKIFNEEIEIISTEEAALKYILGTIDKGCDELEKNVEEYKKIKEYIYENLKDFEQSYVNHMYSGAWGNVKNLKINIFRLKDLYYYKFVKAEVTGKYIAVFCTQIELCSEGIDTQYGQMELMIEISVNEKDNYTYEVTGSGNVSTIL